MNEMSKERHRRLARTAAAAWAEIDQFLGAAPDMADVANIDKLFRLQSAAAQADYAYFDNVDAEDAADAP